MLLPKGGTKIFHFHWAVRQFNASKKFCTTMLKKVLLLVTMGLATIGVYAQNGTPEMVNGQLLVKLKPAVETHTFISKFATQSRAGGGVWIHRNLSRQGNVVLLKFDTNSVTADVLLSELESNPQVVSSTADYYIQTRTDPNDPEYEAQWGLERIGVQRVWDISTGGVTANGDTIVVAILDTGFDVYHEDIYPNVWRNHQETPGDGIDNDDNGYTDDHLGWNFIEDSPEHIADPHGHSVAGIIGATGNNDIGVTGINWNIKLMVLEARTISEIIAAYDYIYDQRKRYNDTYGQEGAFVVATNASFGINRLWCEHQPIWGEMYDQLGSVGVLTAAGTANNAWNVDEVGDMPTTCPSDFLITVLNTNPYDERYVGSAYGEQAIDMGAPGHGSYTTKPFDRYGEFNGNSAAAPHLTGSIALLYSLPCANISSAAIRDPESTARRIREVLINGVDEYPALANITRTGGRLNVGNSMEALMSDCQENQMIERTLTLRPNPVRTYLDVQFPVPGAAERPEISIIDALGRVHYASAIDAKAGQEVIERRLSVEGWPTGTYIAILRLNGQTYSEKFIIAP